MDIEIKRDIEQYIKLLSEILPTEHEFSLWMPNCIECLQFALDNEEELKNKPYLYKDTIHTILLLNDWIFKDNVGCVYIELREKFKTIYSPIECVKALKEVVMRLNIQNEKTYKELYENNNLINCKNNDGTFKSMEQIFSELSDQFKWL